MIVIDASACDRDHHGRRCGLQLDAGRPTSANVRVSGRVLNFTNNAGVSGAMVGFGDVKAMTDVSGSYAVTLPAIGRYEPLVDGASVGLSLVTGTGYRGDFLVRGSGCVARYGTIADAASHRPIAGATVSLVGTAITDADGWYRIDLGCPENGMVGFNTIFLTVTHSLYNDASQVAGRGVSGVSRLDVDMQHR